jgi:hypothetical protein
MRPLKMDRRSFLRSMRQAGLAALLVPVATPVSSDRTKAARRLIGLLGFLVWSVGLGILFLMYGR